MKLSQQTKLSIIFIIFLIFLFGILIFFLLKQKLQPPLTPPTPPSLLPPTSPTTLQPQTLIPPDTTANWRVYRNEKYGFELKYPSWWVLEEDYHLKSYPQFIIRKNEKLTSAQYYGTTSITIMPRGYPAGELPFVADVKEEETIFAGKRAHTLYFLTTEGIVWGKNI